MQLTKRLFQHLPSAGLFGGTQDCPPRIKQQNYKEELCTLYLEQAAIPDA